MNHEQTIIEKANKYFENNIFEIYYLTDMNWGYSTSTNIKVEITGIREYISMGNDTEFVTVTIYILPTNEKSDKLHYFYRNLYGHETKIETYYSGPYQNLVWVVREKMNELLKYFSLPEAMITKVVNEVESSEVNESLIVEGQLDKTTRTLVQDVIGFFKHQREGEFGLPEDFDDGRMVYQLPGFVNFSVFLDLQLSDDVETVDVDGDLYYDDDILYLTIISNPNSGYTILDELTKELNEVIRHELQHIRQHEKGYEFPKKEPKSPEKYYTQPHELEAQRAGFKKRAKSEKADFETLVRNWFQKNPHKHNLKPNQQEKVIQQILQK